MPVCFFASGTVLSPAENSNVGSRHLNFGAKRMLVHSLPKINYFCSLKNVSDKLWIVLMDRNLFKFLFRSLEIDLL